jgi:hypothetical protein
MISTIVLLTQCSISRLLAQVAPDPQSMIDRQSAGVGYSAAPHVSAAEVAPRSTGIGDIASRNSEVFRSVYLGLGGSVALNSKLDYSFAGSVAIGLQCIICDTSATSLGASGLVLQAQWTVPDAGLYATTESKAATTFLYWDSGGAIFNVYGSKFRLVLQNKGKQPIAIEQITFLARSN